MNSHILSEGNRRRVVLVMAALIFAILIQCILHTMNTLKNYACDTASKMSQVISKEIEAYFASAEKAIILASETMSNEWIEGLDEDPDEFIERILPETPFEFIEFVNADGINMMSGADRFDASDREYYTEGIKGRSGLWVNYHPKKSKEFLLDFYSPVIVSGEIRGILVGSLGAYTSIAPRLEVDYFGRDTICILYDEKLRVVSASFETDQELFASDLFKMFNVTQEDSQTFLQRLTDRDATPFLYVGERGDAMGCAGFINDPKWGVLVIIPSTSFSGVVSDFILYILFAAGVIMIILTIYIVYVSGSAQSRLDRLYERNRNIMSGFSKIYKIVFIIDTLQGTAECLRSMDPLASKYDIREGAHVEYPKDILSYLSESAAPQYDRMLKILGNPERIKRHLKDHDHLGVMYKMENGDSSKVVVTSLSDNVGSPKASESGRLLMVISDIEIFPDIDKERNV